MYLKKLLVILIVLFISSPLIAYADQNSQEINFTIASAFQPSDTVVDACYSFAEILKNLSNGRIIVSVKPGGVFGSEEEITELCAEGGVEAHAGGGMPIAFYAPEFVNIDAPYIYRDFSHYMKILHPKSKIGKLIHENIMKNGNQIMLAPFYRGMRQFTSNKPVRNAEDVMGLKLRLPSHNPFVVVWRQIGALPVTIPLTELYIALETGAVDASEGPAGQIWSSGVYEVQKYISLTNHFVQGGWIDINKQFFNSLSPEDQNLIKTAAINAAAETTRKVSANEEELYKKMGQKGVIIIRDVDVASFYDKARPALLKMIEKVTNIGEDDILELLNWTLPEDYAPIENAYLEGLKK